MSASDRPRPDGPSASWLVPVIGGLLGALAFSYWVNFQLPSSENLSGNGMTVAFILLPYLFIVWSVGLVLWGIAKVPLWLRLRGLARQYPYEPWRWEFPRGAELLDDQAVNVAASVVAILFFIPLLLMFTGLLLWLLLGGEAPIPVVIFMTGIISVMGWHIVRKGLIPAITRILAFMRYGQTRLRLRQFPLVPGSKTPVKLTIPRGLANLEHVRGVVRRVRERTVESGPRNKRDSHTVQNVEVRQPQFINAQEGQSGNTLSFVLTVPPGGPEDSTQPTGAIRCFWELQLTSDVPGLDLDITFRLPVYWVDEYQAPAA